MTTMLNEWRSVFRQWLSLGDCDKVLFSRFSLFYRLFVGAKGVSRELRRYGNTKVRKYENTVFDRVTFAAIRPTHLPTFLKEIIHLG